MKIENEKYKIVDEQYRGDDLVISHTIKKVSRCVVSEITDEESQEIANMLEEWGFPTTNIKMNRNARRAVPDESPSYEISYENKKPIIVLDGDNCQEMIDAIEEEFDLV